VELCWGQGSYGPHVWTAEFTVHGLVQAFNDADGFNFMFVNPGLAAPPQHVKITLVNGTGGPQWTYDNTLVWGFGSYGDINVQDGAIVYESLEPYSDGSSAIILTRFEKGMFAPTVSRDMSFDELREKALKGSSYGENDKEETFFKWLMALLFGGVLFAAIRAAVLQALGYKYKKSMYGKTKITEWFREAPMGGNLFASSYVLDHGWRFAGPASSKNLIGALFLRWILDGKVKVVPDPDKPKRVNLAFTPGLEFEDDVEGALYRMALEASGGNLLLESGEFEKWSERHYKQFLAWPDRAKARGRSYLHEKNYLQHPMKYALLSRKIYEESDDAGRDYVHFKGKMRIDGTTEVKLKGIGNGPIDAFFNALKSVGLDKYRFISYSQHAIGEGSDAKAVSYIELQKPDGKNIFGIGIDSNVNIASVLGVLNAINRAET
jgi:hypothetical protein